MKGEREGLPFDCDERTAMTDKTSHSHQCLGPGGTCVCPQCGTEAPHRNGVPCQQERCPRCGAKLLRKGSHHHQLYEAKHGIGPGA